jgi:hypothetical protein
VLKIYLHIQFHTPISNGLLVVAVELKIQKTANVCDTFTETNIIKGFSAYQPHQLVKRHRFIDLIIGAEMVPETWMVFNEVHG